MTWRRLSIVSSSHLKLQRSLQNDPGDSQSTRTEVLVQVLAVEVSHGRNGRVGRSNDEKAVGLIYTVPSIRPWNYLCYVGCLPLCCAMCYIPATTKAVKAASCNCNEFLSGGRQLISLHNDSVARR